MLLIIKTRLAPSIGLMHEMVLRCIFDSEHFTKNEREVLDDGINTWKKKIDLSSADAWEIVRIENALKADERGHWNRAKELIKKHNVDFLKMYKVGIPFVVNPDKCRTFGKG